MEIVDKIVLKKISEIRPYARNPRKNEKTVELLVKIIPVAGFNVPIVIDHQGVIVKGHARYAAAIRLGMEIVPCVVTDADEETIKLDRLTDNKISEFSEWIDEDVLHELDMIDPDFDIVLRDLGFGVETPDFPDFTDDTPIEEAEPGETDAQRMERYAAYMEARAAEESNSAEIVTQEQIDKAKSSAVAVAEKPPRYYKVVCEHCGNVMFIREGDAVFLAE